MTVATPKRGTIVAVHHVTTDEHLKEAICRHCGCRIETGWGEWVHSDDTSGRPECDQEEENRG